MTINLNEKQIQLLAPILNKLKDIEINANKEQANLNVIVSAILSNHEGDFTEYQINLENKTIELKGKDVPLAEVIEEDK